MRIINSYSTLLNWPIVSLLILFLSFSNVFGILVHDYTLCFICSPCCNVSYYNYISVWPYFIVIHWMDAHSVWVTQKDFMIHHMRQKPLKYAFVINQEVILFQTVWYNSNKLAHSYKTYLCFFISQLCVQQYFAPVDLRGDLQ